jgi:hypothetical protein
VCVCVSVCVCVCVSNLPASAVTSSVVHEVRLRPLVDLAQRGPAGLGRLDGHEDDGGKVVRWLGVCCQRPVKVRWDLTRDMRWLTLATLGRSFGQVCVCLLVRSSRARARVCVCVCVCVRVGACARAWICVRAWVHVGRCDVLAQRACSTQQQHPPHAPCAARIRAA